MDLSILCVTSGAPHSLRFLAAMRSMAHAMGAEFVIAVDGLRVRAGQFPRERVVSVKSAGFVESVLDESIAQCQGDYILRLDDDERCSPAMVGWLASGAWQEAPAWKFATAGLWGAPDRVLVMPELWPQYHVRLTTKALAGGQRRVHQRHPADASARVAPVVLEHHKFLVKSLDQRKAIADRYDQIKAGAGKPCHSVPELAYDVLQTAPLGDGTLREFAQDEIQSIKLGVVA